MSEPPNRCLLIRADASTEIGAGHVMRCLALAQGWKENGGRAAFVMAIDSPASEKRVSGDGFEVRRIEVDLGGSDDAAETVIQAKTSGASWVVVDGYHFGADYQRALKDAGLRVLVVDDNGEAGEYVADIVLNQNLHATEAMYEKRGPHTRLLLGTKYVLLRREFLAYRGWKREIPDVARKVLLTMGGGDPDNVTTNVVRALDLVEVDGLEAVVVVGGSNRHLEEIKTAASDSQHAVRVERNVANMPELMAWADSAVSAAGATTYELAFMGLPVVLVMLAENQRPVAEEMASEGVAVNLGWGETLIEADIRARLEELLGSVEARRRVSARGRQLVDVQGSRRVVRAMRGARLALRRVTEQDARLLWEWANDPDVRRWAFRSDPIPWREHVHWLSGKLRDTDCVHFIALEEGRAPIGQIRFDVADGRAEIDVSVAKEKRGVGHGSSIIRMGVEELTRRASVGTAHAFVKVGNRASIRAFEMAGFENRCEGEAKGHPCVHLTWEEQ